MRCSRLETRLAMAAKEKRKGRSPAGKPWEGPWDEKGRALDLSDVADWFSRDPRACVSDSRSQDVLRSHEQPSKPWYGVHRLSEMLERQNEPWWRELEREVRRLGVPSDLCLQFADYLAGFALVRYFEVPKVDQRDASRVSPDWRRAKRFQKRLGFDPEPSLKRPRRESLRTSVTRLMEEQLTSSPSKWKRQFCGRTLCELWRLVEEEISQSKGNSDPELEDQTVARISRRSRRRNKPPTKS
jgi:hypothetical protein